MGRGAGAIAACPLGAGAALEVVALLHPVQAEVPAVFSALLARFVLLLLVLAAVPVPPVPPRSVRPPG